MSGQANGIDFVPDWNFGGCCDNHDTCYDDCRDGLFESCNDFHGCMRNAREEYDHWWEFYVILRVNALSGAA